MSLSSILLEAVAFGDTEDVVDFLRRNGVELEYEIDYYIASGANGDVFKVKGKNKVIKLEKYKQAAANCEKAVELQRSLKGFFRLAQCQHKMNLLAEARKSLEEAEKEEPGNKEVAKLMKKVEAGIMRERAKEKKMYGAMFG